MHIVVIVLFIFLSLTQYITSALLITQFKSLHHVSDYKVLGEFQPHAHKYSVTFSSEIPHCFHEGRCVSQTGATFTSQTARDVPGLCGFVWGIILKKSHFGKSAVFVSTPFWFPSPAVSLSDLPQQQHVVILSPPVTMATIDVITVYLLLPPIT